MIISDKLDNLKYPATRFRNIKQVNLALDSFLTNTRKHVTKGLHLGAGPTRIDGLINCDLFNPAADMKLDATNLESIENESIDWIESHHMIEHLSFKDTDTALTEWNRVLKNRGLIVLTCPDMYKIAQKWLAYSLIYPFRPRPEKLDYIVKMLVGSQEHDGMYHKNIFDARRMTTLLAKHGFDVEFTYSRYPRRQTPSLLVIARKTRPASNQQA